MTENDEKRIDEPTEPEPMRSAGELAQEEAAVTNADAGEFDHDDPNAIAAYFVG
jgi:hypothetical protein